MTLTADTTVTATFNVRSFSLTVSKGGAGSGTVTSSPTGIACGGDCSEVYPNSTQVILTATPDAGSTFSGWSGAGCNGTGTCTVTLTADIAVTATFDTGCCTLTVSKAGNGIGTVTSSPAGISCGADCSERYPSGTVVTLTATPDAGSSFGGWSGALSCALTGTPSCTVTLDSNKVLTATFAQGQTFTLKLSKGGSGNGTVTGSPGGISCGADCSELYSSGTVVTLTASALSGSSFSGWSGGGCSGTGTCTVTVTADTTVTATFEPASRLACDLQMSQSMYVNGEMVTAQRWRVSNANPTAVPVEAKLWFEVPGLAPLAYLNVGAQGDVQIPANFDEDLGPLSLAPVAPEFPRGSYEFNCRLLDPVTGARLAEDPNPFAIERPSLKLPFPGEAAWLLRVEAGGNTLEGGIDLSHMGEGYYTLGFEGVSEEDGPLADVPVLAAAGGQVIDISQHPLLGSTVVIDHDDPYNGTGYTSRYASLKTPPAVAVSQMVGQGEVLGRLAGTRLQFQVAYQGRSAASVTELQGLRVEGRAIEDYTVGAVQASDLRYYRSTNTVIPGPACEIQLSQPTYTTGETVTAQVARLVNPASAPAAIELKLWFEGPGVSPISFVNLGADGSVVLPAGFDQDFGPLPLAPVPQELPRGAYAFNCRLLDPVTGRLLSEDLNPFTIP